MAQAAQRERQLTKKAEKEKAAALKAQQAPPPSRGSTLRRPTLRGKERERDRSESNAAGSNVDGTDQSLQAHPHNARPATSKGETVRPNVPPVPSAGFDAPKSAVNAGARTVTVKHVKTSVTLQVTPDSSPKDLLESAQKELGIRMMADQMTLVESFEQLGLERPLRWYERVRDMLNSWDTDQQNRLLLEPHSASANGADLDVRDAPKEQPGDTSVNIYHSQKPGTWDKRWVTLRSDGQVLAAKSSGSEAKNICHMSDFDVYFPTARQAKRLKPPKKHCFAIKSQQKAAMFLSTENFVHFFATKDREVANAWYKAVQGWRSWYLVHEMGLGAKPSDDAAATNTNHARQHSLSKGPLLSELGSFKPLMPLGGFLSEDAPLALAAEMAPKATDSPPRPFNDRGGPPVSYPRKLSKDPTANTTSSARHRAPSKSSIVQGPPPSAADESFAATGLLGRTYSQRQKALQDPSASHDAVPPMPGIRPLVDLTPAGREPPPHARKGHGVTPEQLPAGGLVGAATTPEQAYNIPVATTWQRASNGLQRTGTLRERPSGEHVRGRPSVEVPRGRLSVEQQRPDGVAAFTGGGLLASAGASQDGRMRGRGVRSGDRAAVEPMIDVKERSKFASGSLLADVERWEGDEGGLVVDRERRVEGTVKTGEAV